MEGLDHAYHIERHSLAVTEQQRKGYFSDIYTATVDAIERAEEANLAWRVRDFFLGQTLHKEPAIRVGTVENLRKRYEK